MMLCQQRYRDSGLVQLILCDTYYMAQQGLSLLTANTPRLAARYLIYDAPIACELRCGVVHSRYMARIIIPKKLAGSDDLVIIPKKEFDDLSARAENAVGEQEVLRWSREAKQLHRAGKLPKLTSLRRL